MPIYFCLLTCFSFQQLDRLACSNSDFNLKLRTVGHLVGLRGREPAHRKSSALTGHINTT